MPPDYRCPRCQTPSAVRVCPACGPSASDGDATWYLPDPEPPPVPGAGLPGSPAEAPPRSLPVDPSGTSVPVASAEDGTAGSAVKGRRRKAAAVKPRRSAQAPTATRTGKSVAPVAKKRGKRKAAATTPKAARAPALPSASNPSDTNLGGPAGTAAAAAAAAASRAATARAAARPTPPPPRSVASDDPVGFEGRYELLGEIGAGGMGVVFKAYDRELDEIIALKSLAEAVRTNPGRIARFKTEIKLARKLSHPNIARVHDLVELHGRLCLSMAYIEGRSLDKIVRAEGPLAPARVLKYLGELGPALALAHSSGIVHRDIKPANIIVDAADSPHIVDFGIAASGSDSSTARVGTPSYMAPECWLVGQPGVTVDARCDLYALGITLYELVTGHVPFASRDMTVLIEMHCQRPPLRPQAIAAGVPDLLDEIILRLLEKEPANRFQSAQELLDFLDPNRRGSARAMRPRPAGTVPPILKPPGSRGKILLAESEPSMRKLLGDRIRRQDFLVVDAIDGVEALEKSFVELPDLILLDSELVALDVLDAIRLLRKDPRTRHVPVVVLSERDDPDYEALARDVGASAYFAKPVPPAVLDLLLGRYFG